MTQGRPPANAPAMHARLEALGVVDRVRRVLLAAAETRDVSDMICWVERHNGDVLVKVAYMHHRKHLVSGRATNSHPDFARFRVANGVAFGPMGSSPLPDELISRIHAILPA